MKNLNTTLEEFSLICQRPIGDIEKTIEDRSRCIMSNLSTFFRNKVKTDGFWKISINVNSDNPLQHNKIVGGVLRYNIEIDIHKFLKQPIPHQKTELLSIIGATLEKIFVEHLLEQENLEKLYDFVINREFRSIFNGPISTENELTAGVFVEQGFEKADVYIAVCAAETEIERYFLLSTSPEEFIFNIYLREPEWVSETQISLKSADDKCYIVNRDIKS